RSHPRSADELDAAVEGADCELAPARRPRERGTAACHVDRAARREAAEREDAHAGRARVGREAAAVRCDGERRRRRREVAEAQRGPVVAERPAEATSVAEVPLEDRAVEAAGE